MGRFRLNKGLKPKPETKVKKGDKSYLRLAAGIERGSPRTDCRQTATAKKSDARSSFLAIAGPAMRAAYR